MTNVATGPVWRGKVISRCSYFLSQLCVAIGNPSRCPESSHPMGRKRQPGVARYDCHPGLQRNLSAFELLRTGWVPDTVQFEGR
jgi:hypothetical protein